MIRFPFLIFAGLVAAGLCSHVGTFCRADDSIDFNRDVKPLLSSRCFQCHGPDESSREADLRLDTFEGATIGGAIEPGEPEASELIFRINNDDESEVMPPPEHGQQLSKAEKEILKKWIESGAKYETHWSYVSPVSPKIPTNEKTDWPKSDIDTFVLHRMTIAGLSPSQPADRYVLARRLALDLTGLPPSLDVAQEFVNDNSADAYEKFVDRLLASPAYGEHWAASWLDMARYADSAGFAEDKQRTIWAYRDYVIRSFQTNKPFDQFTIEQIAGDMLPESNDETMIATAFHRNTLTNSEGGTDDEEFRSAAVVDRTNTTMAVWMGTTMACAQCHTHKYDPITQEEYFQVYALLNNTQDADRPNESPVFGIYSETQLAERAALESKIESVEALAKSLETESAEAVEARLASEQAIWESATLETIQSPANGRFVRVEIHDRVGMLSLAEVQVFSGDNNAALGGTATQSSTYPGGPPHYAIDGNTSGKFVDKTVTHTSDSKNPWWQVDLGKETTIDRISIWNRTDGNLHSRLNGFRVSVLDGDKKTIWFEDFAEASMTEQTIVPISLPGEIATILSIPLDKRTEDQAKKMREHFVETASSQQQQKNLIADLKKKLADIKPATTVPVMREREASEQRETRIQIRGSHANVGDVVQPATPVAFHPIKQKEKNRLALARWLVDRDNPLTARVTVNRYWQKLFGTGLVRTSEDFGAQGDLPSHPELLDYLAVEFMNNGWDNRHILKQMVMSSVYQQSSRVTPAKREQDPNNRWLSRGPRFRVAAEIVRDQALFAGGLLSQKMYGAPVKPPAPALGLTAAFSGQIAWTISEGEDRYRRAIYTQWRRSSPYPSMETFDVSNREVCDLRRISTNTPLQALVTLNDPVFVEAAQGLARRATQSNDDPREIAELAFRLVLIRPPTSAEVDELVRLFEATKMHFSSQPEEALKFATDPRNPVAAGTDMVELASWTTVANVILNLDEVFLNP